MCKIFTVITLVAGLFSVEGHAGEFPAPRYSCRLMVTDSKSTRSYDGVAEVGRPLRFRSGIEKNYVKSVHHTSGTSTIESATVFDGLTATIEIRPLNAKTLAVEYTIDLSIVKSLREISVDNDLIQLPEVSTQTVFSAVTAADNATIEGVLPAAIDQPPVSFIIVASPL